MMTIAMGGELRQLWLLGIQIGVLTGLLLKFFLPHPHTTTFPLLLDGWCQGVIVIVFLCSFLFFFLSFFDKTTSPLLEHQLVSRRSGSLAAIFTTREETRGGNGDAD